METFVKPKGRILWLMSLIYLIAFASLYVQLPGLYGPNGITPVDNVQLQTPKDFNDFFRAPNILRFSSLLNVTNYTAMEFLVLFGTLLALVATSFSAYRTMPTFLLLWLTYLSIYQVGDTFLHFQWDILLLEAGFLTVLLAPSAGFLLPKHASSDKIALWLMKWLLFRLMFASGVVKLNSGCPHWWGLSALQHHFESQCLPTPLAIYMHTLPVWLLKLGGVVTFLVEIGVPFLFFIPLQGVRLFSFYAQLLLQLTIALTGNYNFFNLLTATLCYSLLTDDDFYGASTRHSAPVSLPAKKRAGKKETPPKPTAIKPSRCFSFASHCLSALLIVGVVAVTVLLFKVELQNGTLSSGVAFSKEHFKQFLHRSVQISLLIGASGFLLSLLGAMANALCQKGLLRKLWDVCGVVLVGFVALGLMLSSMVVFSNGLDSSAAAGAGLIPKPAVQLYQTLAPFQVTNSYGLFRRMTGEKGRPELIIEVAQTKDGPWTAVEFHHKPGRVDRRPTVVAPHQPRLDWQMWFAALSSIDQQPWVYTLASRLLAGQPDVLELVESTGGLTTPKFVRASLYRYRFVRDASSAWWQRERLSDYMPAVSVGDNTLKKKSVPVSRAQVKPSQVTAILQQVRARVGQPKDIHALLAVVLVINLTGYFLRR